jgi:hypothetical protein
MSLVLLFNGAEAPEEYDAAGSIVAPSPVVFGQVLPTIGCWGAIKVLPSVDGAAETDIYIAGHVIGPKPSVKGYDAPNGEIVPDTPQISAVAYNPIISSGVINVKAGRISGYAFKDTTAFASIVLRKPKVSGSLSAMQLASGGVTQDGAVISGVASVEILASCGIIYPRPSVKGKASTSSTDTIIQYHRDSECPQR